MEKREPGIWNSETESGKRNPGTESGNGLTSIIKFSPSDNAFCVL